MLQSMKRRKAIVTCIGVRTVLWNNAKCCGMNTHRLFSTFGHVVYSLSQGPVSRLSTLRRLPTFRLIKVVYLFRRGSRTVS